MTTYPVSTVKAAKAWMFSHLTSTLTSDPLSSKLTLGVFYDDPGTAKPSDMVSVGKVHRTVEVNALVGTEGLWAFQETYTLDVIVSVYRGGDAAQATFERACDLVDQVITVQRTDPTLGGAVILSRPQSIDHAWAEWEDDHNGRVAEHTITFFCRGVY